MHVLKNLGLGIAEVRAELDPLYKNKWPEIADVAKLRDSIRSAERSTTVVVRSAERNAFEPAHTKDFVARTQDWRFDDE